MQTATAIECLRGLNDPLNFLQSGVGERHHQWRCTGCRQHLFIPNLPFDSSSSCRTIEPHGSRQNPWIVSFHLSHFIPMAASLAANQEHGDCTDLSQNLRGVHRPGKFSPMGGPDT